VNNVKHGPRITRKHWLNNTNTKLTLTYCSREHEKKTLGCGLVKGERLNSRFYVG
jgi:hypothetical protein